MKEENGTQKQDNSWKKAAIAAGTVGAVGLGTVATVAAIKHHKYKKFENKVKENWTKTMDNSGMLPDKLEREKAWADGTHIRKEMYKKMKKEGIK